MQPDQIADDIKRFISEHIEAVEQLEVLLLLRRESQRVWSAHDVSEEIRTSDMSAEKRLRDLAEHGLLEMENISGTKVYRFQPKRPQDLQVIRNLDEAYAKRPFRIIDLILSRPVDQLRVLANTFRFRKDEGEE